MDSSQKHYLLFASLSYAYSIMRPLQAEIRRRGDLVAWYLEESCPDLLEPDEVRLHTIEEVMAYHPYAVFAPGNWVYDFFPGVKVEVFHGYPINKRNSIKDDHFALRGWFDIYCTQGESSTLPFKWLEQEKGYFKVYETGWCKTDDYAQQLHKPIEPHTPTIFYSTTFTQGIASAETLFKTIRQLAHTKDWKWIVSFHPKYDNPVVRKAYADLAKECPNVTFHSSGLIHAALLNQSDVLLSDTSSVIVEYMMLDKPVVTFRNTHPGPFLLDVQTEDEVGPALEKALTRPAELMEEIHRYTSLHERHRDGQNSARVLDAVDDFVAHHQGRIRRKPLNLFRKLKLRWRLKVWKNL